MASVGELRDNKARSLACEIKVDMQALEPAGLFENDAEIENLWDEACWAIQEHGGDPVGDAADETIEGFVQGTVLGLLKEVDALGTDPEGDVQTELSLHQCSVIFAMKAVKDAVRDLVLNHEVAPKGWGYDEVDEDIDDEDEEDIIEVIRYASEEAVPRAIAPNVPWLLCRRDKDLLIDLHDEIMAWLGFEFLGRESIALGAVLAKIDEILSGGDAEFPVRICWWQRFLSADTERPQINLTDGDISLELVFGMDADAVDSIRCVAKLDSDGGFDSDAVTEWLDQLHDCQTDGAKLHVQFEGLRIAE